MVFLVFDSCESVQDFFFISRERQRDMRFNLVFTDKGLLTLFVCECPWFLEK